MCDIKNSRNMVGKTEKTETSETATEGEQERDRERKGKREKPIRFKRKKCL